MDSRGKLKEIIKDILQADINSEGENTLFIEYENWDSMNFMLFVMDIERIFEISLSNEEIVEMNCFKKCLEIIDAKLT